MQINAIETQYKGYRFRSRLEARWAVFFDAMNVKWEYEKEGFELPSGLYLPDFWIGSLKYNSRNSGWWIEIKPSTLTDNEEALCRELAISTRHVVYALAGNIGVGEFEMYKWHPGYISGRAIHIRGQRKEAHLADYYFDLFLYYLCSQAAPLTNAKVFPARHELDVAFQAARSARFEHGEYPIISGNYSFL